MGEKVSIVIPCFNNERYLGDAIESCLKQTYGNLEIIVVDDHSTDHSLSLMMAYAQKFKNVKYFVNRSKGANAARNFGVVESQGKYIQFLDSDDFLYTNDLIEKQVLHCEQLVSDAIVFCDHASIKESDPKSLRVVRKYGRYKNPDIRDLLIDCIIQTSQLFMPRNLFCHLGGLDETLIKAQEHEFNVRAASKGVKFIHNEIVGVAIRSHNSVSRISNQNPEAGKQNDFVVAEKFKKHALDFASGTSLYTSEELGNEILKYLIFRAQQSGNLRDFMTVKEYSQKIDTLKKEIGVRKISKYRSPLYTFILNVFGLILFEKVRVLIKSKNR